MPSAVVIGILSVATGRLSDLFSPKVLVIFGLVTSALCMFQHTTITTVTSLEAITFWFTVRGFTRAFTITPLTTGSLAPARIPDPYGLWFAQFEPWHCQCCQCGSDHDGLAEPSRRTDARPGPRSGCRLWAEELLHNFFSPSSSWAISPIWRSSKPWPCSRTVQR